MVALVIIAVVSILFAFFGRQASRISKTQTVDPELALARTYEQVKEGDEKKTGSEYVEFDAFFLRDLNGDGDAEGVRGTCKQLGQSDILYMELNVLANGTFSNGKIEIEGDNFYLQTVIPKDDQVKENYVGVNTREILFNDISNGTQKMFTGFVKSGDYSQSSRKLAAIGNDASNYSKANKVILTGTHTGDDGQVTQVRKEVEFNLDWYEQTAAQITKTSGSSNLETAIDEEKEEVNVSFTVETRETRETLILKKNVVEGQIPQLNGYNPTRVVLDGTYDSETRNFKIEKESVKNDSGKVTNTLSRSNSYTVNVTYPLEAYKTLGSESFTLSIPVTTYYEGYNNPNTGFDNPYISNVAKATVVINCRKPSKTTPQVGHTTVTYPAAFDIIVGKYASAPNPRYYVSKEKPLNIYNEVSNEETEDLYTVTWKGYTGTRGQTGKMVMKERNAQDIQVSDQFVKSGNTEESMEDLTSNVGIYFSNQESILGKDGEIKVYDDTTDDILMTFNKNNWNKYTSSNPYKYEIPVKHIRIETSKAVAGKTLYVYNIKELDDEKITTKYTREKFDELQYIKSTLTGYIADARIETATHQAYYEAPISVANLTVEPTAISTQATEKVIMKIIPEVNETYHERKWSNGSFVLKMPKEIIDVKLNDVKIDNTKVQITNYEAYEENGEWFIKVLTENETPTSYTITVDADISANPTAITGNREIELYAANENCKNYYYTSVDTYDVNGNLNKQEKVNKRGASINLISPTSLLTSQSAREYNEEKTTTVAPQVALVDKNQKEAIIDVLVKSNYANAISQIKIVGRIPTTGNQYVINGGNLGSQFDTTILEGIQLPAGLEEKATIYYSTEINPGKDDESWTEQPENWEEVKSYLIDLGTTEMKKDDSYTFTYKIKLPTGINYNQVSYGHHAVYFSLNTEAGRYKTKTEPNKLGFMIAKQYDIELTKYQSGTETTVQGATHKIIEDGQKEGKTGITGTDGKLTLKDLLVEKTYIIKEIKTPEQYELNEGEIKFTTKINGDGSLTAELLSGTVKGQEIKVTQDEDKNYKLEVKVEDKVRPNLKIVKTEQETDNKIERVRFKITGKGLPEKGKTITTNSDGEASLKGLYVDQQYTLEEVKVEGYYLVSPMKFTIKNNEGAYTVEFEEENTIEQSAENTDNIPTVVLKIQDEKIPTYNLEIAKVAKDETRTPLQGAKFKLIYEGKEIGEYTTEANGKVTIQNLYQYAEGRDVNGTYTLKEVLAPEGYAKVKDITFKVENKEEGLVFEEESQPGQTAKNYVVDNNTIKLIIEDSPSFKLTKKMEQQHKFYQELNLQYIMWMKEIFQQQIVKEI